MGDVKALDAMVQDGLRNPFSGKQMFEEATEVGDELEMTRADLDKLGAALARARDRGDRRGPPAGGDRPGDDPRRARATPWSRSTRRRAAAPRSRRSRSCPASSRKDGSHTAGNSPGVNDGARRARARPEEWAERNGKEILATIIAQAAVADEFAYLARTPANAAQEGARQGRAAAGRHRPVGDQRGVRLRDPELDRGCSTSTRSA